MQKKKVLQKKNKLLSKKNYVLQTEIKNCKN